MKITKVLKVRGMIDMNNHSMGDNKSMFYRGLPVRGCNCGAADEGHAPDCSYVFSCGAVELRFQGDSEVAAVRFCEVLREWLTPEELVEAVSRNAADPDPDVCHTHDFCDANMAMEEALAKTGLRVCAEAGKTPDYELSVREEAWRRSKAAKFDPDAV